MFRHDPTYLTYSSMWLCLNIVGHQSKRTDLTTFLSFWVPTKSCRKLYVHCLGRWMCQGLRPRPSIGCGSQKGGFLKWWYRGTQQPWVFLLKMIILGEMGVRPFKETPKKSLGCLGFLHWEGLIPGRGLDHYTFFFSHMDFGSFHLLESHYSSTIWKGNKPDV